jgi:hypothetical protein
MQQEMGPQTQTAIGRRRRIMLMLDAGNLESHF